MSTNYKRLPFEQYYIDTSKDWRDTGKARFKMDYNHVEYVHKFLGLFAMKFSSEWECHYEADRNVIQVNFEQTHGAKDWIANFLFASRMYDEFKATVGNEELQIRLKGCKGWTEMWFMMKHQVRNAVKALLDAHKDAEVEVIGWSLGSSQAQYCAQDLSFNLGVKAHLFTYGSVKPWKSFNKDVKKYLSSCVKEAWNFMHKSDIVTYMPPFAGYFAIKPVKLGKLSLRGLLNPQRWHTEYGESYLYESL